MGYKKWEDWQGTALDVWEETPASDIGAGLIRHVWQGEKYGVLQKGTTLKADMMNNLQMGLDFLVDSNHTVINSEDHYIITIDGLKTATSNPDGYELVGNLHFSIKITEENANGISKLIINGDSYDLQKKENDVVVELNNVDLKAGKIYSVYYDGARFLIKNSVLPSTETEAGITKYGTEEMTALEGQRLSQILGAEYGGEVQTIETKEMGKAYYDQTTKFLYLCTETNTLNYADLTKYAAFSNLNLLNEINTIKTTVVGSINLAGTTEIYLERKGDIATLNIDSGTAFDGRIAGQVLFTLPAGWRPKHNIHCSLVPGAGQTQTAPMIIRSNGQAIFIGSGTLSQPKYGTITYFL